MMLIVTLGGDSHSPILLSTKMHLVNQYGVKTLGKKRPTGLNVDLSINNKNESLHVPENVAKYLNLV